MSFQEKGESQIVAPLHEMENISPSEGSDTDDRTNSDIAAHHLSDEFFGEQSDPRQDSFGSRIEDTQFIDLEIDTQCSEHGINRDTIPERDVQDASSFNILPAEGFIANPVFARPALHDAEDLGAGFKFGRAAKIATSQFIRPQPKLSGNCFETEQVVKQLDRKHSSALSLSILIRLH